MIANPKWFKTIFNKNPKRYTDVQKLKMIRTVQKAIQPAPTRPKDSILFLKGDAVQKVMDLSKINTLYEECFGDSDIDTSYIYAFYIVGKSVSSIVSTIAIEVDNKSSATLWNVCNDLQIKGGYMRVLMDATLEYIHKKLGLKKVQLYVLLSNPYYDKAVALYKSKGFKVDTRFVSEYGDRIRMSHHFL